MCHAFGGIDKSIVLDRRGSVKISSSQLIERMVDRYGRGWITRKMQFADEHFLLEVGFTQWLLVAHDIRAKQIKVGGFATNDMEFTGKFEVERRFDESVNLAGVPISIRLDLRRHRNYYKFSPFQPEYWDVRSTRDFDFSREQGRQRIVSPILMECGLAKVLDPIEVYKALLNYITATRADKAVDIGTTDLEKANNHGFDELSFRHPTKL